MNKKAKIFFIIFIGLAIILILIVNLIIKGYEREAIHLPLSEQEEIKPEEIRPIEPAKQEEYIEEDEEIEQEGLVSGPLIY